MNRVTPAARAGEGTAAVEFALSLPVVLLLILGILDLGRALSAYVTVGNASREGLRFAQMSPAAGADIAGAVSARSAPLDASRLSVTATYSNDSGSSWQAWATGGSGAIIANSTAVRVAVSYPWSAVTWTVGAFFVAGSGSATFTSTATGIAGATRP